MRFVCSAFFLSIGLMVACSADSTRATEGREFLVVETHLADLNHAAPEDRPIRLAALAEVELKSERVDSIRDICVVSYQSYGQSLALFADARAKTSAVENAVKQAQEETADGSSLDSAQKAALEEMKRAAEAALQQANQTLNRAEREAKACQQQRDTLRAQLQTR